jgi:hypothetical protein
MDTVRFRLGVKGGRLTVEFLSDIEKCTLGFEPNKLIVETSSTNIEITKKGGEYTLKGTNEKVRAMPQKNQEKTKK